MAARIELATTDNNTYIRLIIDRPYMSPIIKEYTNNEEGLRKALEFKKMFEESMKSEKNALNREYA